MNIIIIILTQQQGGCYLLRVQIVPYSELVKVFCTKLLIIFSLDTKISPRETFMAGRLLSCLSMQELVCFFNWESVVLDIISAHKFCKSFVIQLYVFYYVKVLILLRKSTPYIMTSLSVVLHIMLISYYIGSVCFFVRLVELSYQCTIFCQVLRPPTVYKRRNNIIYGLVTDHKPKIPKSMRIH